MAEAGVDCLLLTSLPNIFYLTGFTGTAGVLLVTEKSSTLYTDGRYGQQAAEEVQQARVAVARGEAASAAVGRARRYRRLGFEASASYAFFRLLADKAGGRRLEPLRQVVERLRMIKDQEEVERIRRAVELNARVFRDVLPLLRPGVSERDVAAELEYRMRRYGAEKAAFDSIVAAGPRSAMPHARAGARPAGRNEFLLLDHGAILAHYASDMTRTVYLGAADRRARQLYGVVREAQQRAVAAVRAGCSCAEVDRAARDCVSQRGYASQFPHSTGHGLGIEVHEIPRIAAREKTSLGAGAVITIEPGVYVPGFGGVRIEDVVVVREGGAEVLTPTPRELLEL